MLVLSRKTNESITIEGGVEIKVIGVSGNRVKLGIEAPASLHIARTELLSIASHLCVAETTGSFGPTPTTKP